MIQKAVSLKRVINGTAKYYSYKVLNRVKKDEMDERYFVKKGLCSKDLALRIFNAYFLLNGRERMEYLNLDYQ